MMPPICTPRRADDAAPVGDRPAPGRIGDRLSPVQPAPRRADDARRRCFAAVFPSFCRGFGLFWRGFSRIFGDFDG